MVVVGAHVGRNGCADYADSMGVGSENHLLIRAFDPVDEPRVGCGGDLAVEGQATQIVDALKNDEPFHSGLGQHVAIEAGEGVGTKTVGEQVVAADSLIQNAYVAGRG